MVRSICSCRVQQCRASPLDLIFVLDASDRATPEPAQELVSSLLQRSSVGQDTTHVGMVIHGGTQQSLPLSWDLNQISSFVRSPSAAGGGGSTERALLRAQRLLAEGRAGVKVMVVVVSDVSARQWDWFGLEQTLIDFYSSSVDELVVAVVDRSTPQLLTSQPKNSLMVSQEHFTELEGLENKLLRLICEEDQRRSITFSSSPTFSLGPDGLPEIFTYTEEEPTRKQQTDTYTSTGDPPRVKLVPDDVTVHTDGGYNLTLSRPAPEDRVYTEVQGAFDPFDPEFLPQFETQTPSLQFTRTGPTADDTNTLNDSQPLLSTENTDEEATRCSEPLDPGPCRDYLVRWYYDPIANTCAQFWFGGCMGNGNRFETERSCLQTCVRV